MHASRRGDAPCESARQLDLDRRDQVSDRRLRRARNGASRILLGQAAQGGVTRTRVFINLDAAGSGLDQGAFKSAMPLTAARKQKSLEVRVGPQGDIAERSAPVGSTEPGSFRGDPLKSLRPDECAQDQYDFAGYINCLHRHLAIADDSRVDLSDPVSYSKRYGQFSLLELPSRSRST